jgi:membrane protein DedA with SNARE-associated domain
MEYVEEEQAAEHSTAEEWIKRNFSLIVLAMAFAIFVLPYVTPFEGLNVFQRFSEWTLRQLERLFKDYGYWVVFFGVLLENSMFLGLLVPGSIILILAGLAAENGAINVYYVIGLAACATIIGDTISYFVGRFGGTKALERAGVGDMVERVREPMESNSTWIILAYHFAGYSRAVGPAAAGLFRIRYRKWAPLDYVGGCLWAVALTGLGVVLGLAGVEFGDTKRMVRLLELAFLGVFAVAITVAIVRAQRGDQRDKRAAPATVVVPVDDQE